MSIYLFIYGYNTYVEYIPNKICCTICSVINNKQHLGYDFIFLIILSSVGLSNQFIGSYCFFRMFVIRFIRISFLIFGGLPFENPYELIHTDIMKCFGVLLHAIFEIEYFGVKTFTHLTEEINNGKDKNVMNWEDINELTLFIQGNMNILF